MKVCFVTDYFPPDSYGGSDISTYYLAKGLSRHELDVTVLTSGVREESYFDEGVEVFRKRILKPLSIPRNPYLELAYNSTLVYKRYLDCVKNFLKGDNFDILHTHDYISMPGTLLAAKQCKTPAVGTIRNYSPICYFSDVKLGSDICLRCSIRNFVRCFSSRNSPAILTPFALTVSRVSMFIRKMSLGGCSYLIAISNAVKNTLLKSLRYPQNRIVVIPNIMPHACHLQTKSPLGQENCFIYAGRLSPEKGVKVLIKAVKQIPTTFDFSLYIIGDGPEKTTLNELAKGEQRIKFLGWLTNNDVLDYISRSIAVVLPAVWHEPLSRCVFEAMACGKPVIATNTGGTPEQIVDGYNGSLIPPFDCEKMAETMIYYLENPVKALEMGKNARKLLIEKFSPDELIGAHIRLYREILEEQG